MFVIYVQINNVIPFVINANCAKILYDIFDTWEILLKRFPITKLRLFLSLPLLQLATSFINSIKRNNSLKISSSKPCNPKNLALKNSKMHSIKSILRNMSNISPLEIRQSIPFTKLLSLEDLVLENLLH